jgi:hypothetical protein
MRRLVRRWYTWLPALLVAAGLGYVGYGVMYPAWEGTEAWEKYRQIRLGMTVEEAAAVLGIPSDGWRGGPVGLDLKWKMGDDVIYVGFHTTDSRATGKAATIQGHSFYDPPIEETWWDRLRARLGW